MNVCETIPPGTEPAPGYFMEAAEGGPWFRQDGSLTLVWSERGLWPTKEAAAEALERFCQ